MKMFGLLPRLAVVVASSFNYAGACLLIAIWGVNPVYYLMMIFAISVMIGAVMVDLRDSIIYTYVSMGIGIVIATAIFMGPYMLFQEPVYRVNAAIMVFFSAIIKAILFGLIIYFLGALLGSYLGEKSLE